MLTSVSFELFFKSMKSVIAMVSGDSAYNLPTGINLFSIIL